MSTSAYQTVPVTCPNCQNQFAAPVATIIDVGQTPEAKSLLLSGRLNVAICPQCGSGGRLSTPLVYHDPEKELLFTYMPPELGASEVEQQRVIGELTNQVMSSLPAEQRKGYLLRPQNFLRLEGMIEAILEAEGISKEMLEAQRAKAALLDRLLQTTSEDARRTIVQENEGQIDYEFFQLLTMNLEMAQAEGQIDVTRQLATLRTELLEWTSTGEEIAAREEAIRSLGSEVTREGLLDKLVEAALAEEQTKVETLVAVARPAIDYVFYQQLTERIEAAQEADDAERVKTLKELRETILSITAEIDAEMEKATGEALQFLEEILEEKDLEAAVRANLPQIDELFLGVLAGELDKAERTDQAERAEKLQQISEILLEIIQESQPPEVRFINQLLQAEYPEGSQALLEENRDRLDEDLLGVMDLISQDLRVNDREPVAERLEQIREQAQALM